MDMTNASNLELFPYLCYYSSKHTKRSMEQLYNRCRLGMQPCDFIPAVPLAMIRAQDTLARQPTASNAH